MPEQIIAVGVGNSSVQFGRFDVGGKTKGRADAQLPTPIARDVFPSRRDDGQPNEDWDVLDAVAKAANSTTTDPAPWYIASVFREAAEAVAKWIEDNEPGANVRFLDNDSFLIEIDTESPQLVGTDRIAAATAAARIKHKDRPAIFVDAGTALTVNAVSSANVFLGGAILPGTTTSGTALNKSTDQLPRIVVTADKPSPTPIGRATNAAIASGIYWGSVGAVKELVARMSDELAERGEIETPEVFVTGGFGPALAKQLGDTVQCIPHLVLSGIALSVVK